MQDQFFGDINDYHKYGLLRCLCEVKLCVGVCWMYTPRDDSGQGGKVDYLNELREHRHRDPRLFDFLKDRVVSGHRAVRQLEEASKTMLPGAKFFSETLPKAAVDRKGYFDRASAAFRAADVIFFDPDIGIAPPSAARSSSKHLRWDEVDQVSRGADRVSCREVSVVVYWHRPRAEPRDEFLRRASSQLRDRMPPGAFVYTVHSQDVLFLLGGQPTHRDRLQKASEILWKRWNGAMTWREIDPPRTRQAPPARR